MGGHDLTRTFEAEDTRVRGCDHESVWVLPQTLLTSVLILGAGKLTELALLFPLHIHSFGSFIHLTPYSTLMRLAPRSVSHHTCGPCCFSFPPFQPPT